MNIFFKLSLLSCTLLIFNCFAMEKKVKPPVHNLRSSNKRTISQTTLCHRFPVQKKQRLMSREERELFLQSIDGNNVKKIESYLNEFEVDLNKPLYATTTALAIAVKKGYQDMVRHLVEKRKVKCSTDQSGEFYLALTNSQSIIANYLIKYFSINVDRPIEPDTLKTPLHIAFEKKSLPLIKVLINHQADVMRYDKEGHTPLVYLAHADISLRSVLDILNYLYGEHGILEVDSNVSNLGSTLLHEAVKHGNLPLIKVLVEKYNAHVEAVDYEYDTPLQLAFKEKQTTIVEYLKSIEVG